MTSASTAPRTLWIAWEQHRRSREISRALGAELHEMHFGGPYLLRSLVLALRTAALCLRKRPDVLFVQNPSMVLAAVAGFLKPIFGYRLVVDRHSNFKLHTQGSRAPKYRLFHAFSRYSIRRADITIVTNAPLQRLVDETGGRGFRLPDKIPELTLGRARPLGPGAHVVYVCSFDDDEPVAEVFAAARLLESGFTVHVTGNPARMAGDPVLADPPANIRFTGYLEEQAYQDLLFSTDIVLTLTSLPHIMQCGGYEALAAGKPLVCGEDAAMVEYFGPVCTPTGLAAPEIADAIRRAYGNRHDIAEAISGVRAARDQEWETMRDDLARAVGLAGSGGTT